MYALAGRHEPRPYRPYDLSRDDFDFRMLALGFLAAGIAVAIVVGLALAGSGPR